MIESATQAPAYYLALALIGGENAVLRIPRHMSEANYTLLKSLLDANLTAMKSALVIAQPEPPANDEKKTGPERETLLTHTEFPVGGFCAST